MKKAVICASIALCTQVSGQTTTSFGGVDCGKWTAATGPTKVAYETWLAGYMSGLNAALTVFTKVDVLKQVDSSEQISQWVSNYCRNNPLERVPSAAQELFAELQRKLNAAGQKKN